MSDLTDYFDTKINTPGFEVKIQGLQDRVIKLESMLRKARDTNEVKDKKLKRRDNKIKELKKLLGKK